MAHPRRTAGRRAGRERPLRRAWNSSWGAGEPELASTRSAGALRRWRRVAALRSARSEISRHRSPAKGPARRSAYEATPPSEGLPPPSAGKGRRDQPSAADERGCLLQVDGTDERVGVAMYDLPVRSFAAINLGDAQRAVLVGPVADLPVLALDHHEDDRVAPSVRSANSSFASPPLK